MIQVSSVISVKKESVIDALYLKKFDFPLPGMNRGMNQLGILPKYFGRVIWKNMVAGGNEKPHYLNIINSIVMKVLAMKK